MTMMMRCLHGVWECSRSFELDCGIRPRIVNVMEVVEVWMMNGFAEYEISGWKQVGGMN